MKASMGDAEDPQYVIRPQDNKKFKPGSVKVQSLARGRAVIELELC